MSDVHVLLGLVIEQAKGICLAVHERDYYQFALRTALLIKAHGRLIRECPETHRFANRISQEIRDKLNLFAEKIGGAYFPDSASSTEEFKSLERAVARNKEF